MIKNIRHTGIVVRDLDKAIKFYEGLGFSMWKKEFESGPYLDKVVGLKNVKIEIAKLKSPCGNLLELLQYHSHPLDKKIKHQPSNQLGCSHIALTVKDIDEVLKNIQANGGSLVNFPITTPDGKFRVAYVHDHEGVLLEIVEEK
jgi:catechol 2,3-dioxygenase-like lactoylglutathione lyase family enzyme